MSGRRVFVCDDETLIRLWFTEHLQEEGYQAECFPDGTSLVEAVRADPPALVLLDLRLPDISGLEALTAIKEIDGGIPVIMMTAYGEVETAVTAVRSGAFHFLEKPVRLPEVLLLMEQALETQGLRGELDRYRAGNQWQFSDVILVGRSSAIQRVADTVSRLGHMGNPANTLIQGETGTGKDLIAKAIHARGPRRAAPFLEVNCTALPEHLIESELFGHEAGAFTGAQAAKKGLLEVAHRGTVFLDEIGDMPRPAQAKLLHFLETQSFRKLGGLREAKVYVHVSAATNRGVGAAIEEGEFRADLFYRLNVIPIYLPPLRERSEDVAPLAVHFCETLGPKMAQSVKEITPAAMSALERYEWPGNARQLRNVLERILLLQSTEVIDLHHLPPEIRNASEPESWSHVLPPDGVNLEALERDLIVQALRRTDGNKTRAAGLLGISRDTLRYRLEKHAIGDLTP